MGVKKKKKECKEIHRYKNLNEILKLHKLMQFLSVLDQNSNKQ